MGFCPSCGTPVNENPVLQQPIFESAPPEPAPEYQQAAPAWESPAPQPQYGEVAPQQPQYEAPQYEAPPQSGPAPDYSQPSSGWESPAPQQPQYGAPPQEGAAPGYQQGGPDPNYQQGYQQPGPQQAAYGQQPYSQMVDPVADANENKFMAIMAYVIVLVPILAGSYKTSPFVKFHTNQGTMLWVIALVLIFVRWVVSFFLYFLGWIFALLSFVIGIAIFVLAILGIMNAANGKSEPLPVIGTLYTFFK